MKKLSPPKIDNLFDLQAFRKQHSADINELKHMLSKRGKELWIQTSLADELRAQQVGDNVSFVINQNINFTQYCIGSCRFCNFRADHDASKEKAIRMSLDDIAIEADKAIARGCTEICIQGGLDPELTFDYYIDILKTIKNKSQQLHIHGFSPAEIAFMSQISNEPVEEILKELIY